MTTPTERTRAVIEMGQSVMQLAPYMHGSTTNVSVPRHLIAELHGWLRHYPTSVCLRLTAGDTPDLWAQPTEGDISCKT